MKKKLFFIFNPLSGKALIKNKLLDIVDVFVKGGYEVQVHPTQEAGEATARTMEAARQADLIVCCGGDGTLDEVVNGLRQADRDIPLGYIPAGSTNDFASSLQISRDMVEAARQIMEGEVRRVDVGSFNDQTFVYVAAFGLFTEVSYETDQTMKNILGYVAYLLEGVKKIFDIKTYWMKVTSDTDLYEGEFIYGMVTNSRSVGGFKNLTGKNVEMDDGYFEVTLIHAPKSALELNEIISCLLTREDTTNLIESFKTTMLTVEADTEVSWTLDGEYGGSPKELVICNQRQALPIILAPSDGRQIPLLG
ncbi:MAG TPA: diacylglycerol kinase [Lachnospiraceae bacterium]|nr:diacylglycerol kinase [Lachnospiraceae bacterium]